MNGTAVIGLLKKCWWGDTGPAVPLATLREPEKTEGPKKRTRPSYYSDTDEDKWIWVTGAIANREIGRALAENNH